MRPSTYHLLNNSYPLFEKSSNPKILANSSVILFLIGSESSTSSRFTSTTLSLSETTIASLTISSTAFCTSGCCSMLRYFVTSSASVFAAPSKSKRAWPNCPTPVADTVTAPSSSVLSTNDGVVVLISSALLISNPNNCI